MSKRYYINNIDSYLGQAIHNEIYKPTEEDPDPESNIIASYTDTLREDKIKGVKKILRVIDLEIIFYSFLEI